jgi:hypothetical protein
LQGVFFQQNKEHLISVLPAYRFFSRQRNYNVVALDLLTTLNPTNPTTSAGLGIRWRRSRRLFGGTALDLT